MAEKTSTRLMSLDALRGFDMLWILYPTYPIFHTLLVALGMKGCWLDLQMTHFPWAGFTFYDTIYPLFMFMSGVSFPYSYAKAKRNGKSDGAVALRLLRRAVVLVLLGSTIFGSLKLDFAHMTLTSVIGRIGIACGLAGLIYMKTRFRTRLFTVGGILLVYWFLPFILPWGPERVAGVSPYATADGCLYWWMGDRFWPRPWFGPEFSATFSMVATALLGMTAGDWLRVERGGLTRGKKALGLLIAGSVAAVLGMLAATAFGRFSVPIIKPIWSTSYALVTAGYAFAILALFYWIIDVRGHVRWSFPLRVIGMNSVFAYLASRTIFPWKSTMTFLFGGVMSYCPTPAWGAFVGELGYVIVYWLLLYLMYRKQLFLRA